MLHILIFLGTWHCARVQPVWCERGQPSWLPCWKRPQAERIQVGRQIIPLPLGSMECALCIKKPKMVSVPEIGAQSEKKIGVLSSRCPLDFDNGAWSFGKKQEKYKFPNSTTTRSNVSLLRGPLHTMRGGWGA